MNNEDKLKIDIKISGPATITLRGLEELRKNLSEIIRSNFSTDQPIELYEEPTSRSLDPAVIGALAVAVSPILVGKIADIVIKFIEHQKEATVTLSVPIEGTKVIQVTYDPANTSAESLKQWVKSAVDATNSSNVNPKPKKTPKSKAKST